MRKNRLGTLIKRTILVLLLVTISLFAIVYFADQYKGTTSSYTNKYSDEYWQKLDGFTDYSDWVMTTHKYNINFPDDYIAPYNESDSLTDKILAARYTEELNVVTNDVYNEITRLEQLKKIILADSYQGTLAQLSLKSMGFKDTILTNATEAKKAYTTLKDKGLTISEADFNAIIKAPYDINKPEINSYKKLVNLGYTGTYLDFINALALDIKLTSGGLYKEAQNEGYSKEKFEWLAEAIGLPRNEKVSAYAFVVENGYYNTRPNWKNDWYNAFIGLDFPYEVLSDFGYDYTMSYELGVAIYNDVATAELETVYEKVIQYDKEKMAEIEAQMVEPNNYIMLANSRNLLSWYDYCRRFVSYDKILENDKFEFWFSGITTEFKLVEKATGNIWYSNPQGVDTTAQSGVQNAQRAIFSISYSALKGVTGSYSSYNHSTVDYDLTSNNKSNVFTPNYATKFDVENNIIQVWYKLEDRSKTVNDFPEYISKTHFEELIARNQTLAAAGAVDSNGNSIPDMLSGKYLSSVYGKLINNYYGLILADAPDNKFGIDYYKLTEPNMGYSSLIELYEWLYEWCQYTEEELQSDNEQFEIELNDNSFSLEMAIEYELTKDGLSILVPGNSIVDSETAPIVSIDLLPYFTATKAGIEGYTIIPDGSGAILKHDNGNHVYTSYSKRVYTTDLAATSQTKQTSTNDVMFPMLGIVNTGNNSGMILECSQGGGQALINADVSGRNDSYNKQNFSFYVRESKGVYIGPSYNRERLEKWSNRRITQDIRVNAIVLEQDELDYSSVAKRYRDILVERYGLQENDKTDKTVLDMDVIGTYEFDNNFLGIPYTDKDTLTTFSELSSMLDLYLSMDIKNINVFYKGWRNSGLIDKSFKNLKISPLLGTKKELLKLMADYKKNVTIYPYLSFGQINKYQESFGQNHYTTRSVDGKFVVIYPYDLNTNIFNKKATKISILSPRFYTQFMTSLVDSYNDTLGISSISLDNIGSNLTGEYKKGIEMYKIDAIEEQIASLELAYNSGINNINLYHPYDYAFKYVSNAKEVPYQSTQYEILDYSIPFYQLVVSGLFDYSSESINANSEKGIQEHLMRILETGSNLSFTFTYDNSSELLNTEYNTYFYTSYNEWLGEVESMYNTLEKIGISRCQLTKHEMIPGYDNVCRVTYTNKVEKIVILLNYSRVAVNVDGYMVPAKGYIVQE